MYKLNENSASQLIHIFIISIFTIEVRIQRCLNGNENILLKPNYKLLALFSILYNILII